MPGVLALAAKSLSHDLAAKWTLRGPLGGGFFVPRGKANLRQVLGEAALFLEFIELPLHQVVDGVDRPRNQNQRRIGNDNIVLVLKPAIELRLLPQDVLAGIMAPIIAVIRPVARVGVVKAKVNDDNVACKGNGVFVFLLLVVRSVAFPQKRCAAFSEVFHQIVFAQKLL